MFLIIKLMSEQICMDAGKEKKHRERERVLINLYAIKRKEKPSIYFQVSLKTHTTRDTKNYKIVHIPP